MNKEFFKNLKENMKTAQMVLKFCAKHRAEFLPAGKAKDDGYILFVPRQLDEADEEELKRIIPDMPLRFEVAPKQQTRDHLENLLRRAKPSSAQVIPDIENRQLTIEMEGVDKTDPVWDEISTVLKKDGFFDKWSFIIEGDEVNVLPKVSEEIAKNKDLRETSIDAGDVMDFKIDLENAQTVEDILKAMG